MIGNARSRAAFLSGAHHERARCLELGSAAVAVYTRDDRGVKAPASSAIIFTGSPFDRGRSVPAGVLRRQPRFADLDGRFGYLAWKPDHVELGTDCIGAGPVYYSVQNGCLYFGSHLGLLLELLPNRPVLNDLGVASQLFARAQLFDESHIRGVTRLAAASRLRAVFDPAREKIKTQVIDGGGVRSLLELDVPALSPDTIREFIDAGVAREEFDAESMLMLSGGNDSLAIALAHGAVPPRACAYGEAWSWDVIASRIRAHKFGMKHALVSRRRWNLKSHAREIAELHGGCSGLQAAQQLAAFVKARKHGNRAAIGFLGDSLTGDHLGTKVRQDIGHALRIVLPDFRDPILKHAFPREAATLREFVGDRFADLSKEVGGCRSLMLLDLEWRQARWISMHFDLCDWFMPIACPFFQKRFIAACLQAEPELLLRQAAYRKALAAGLAERGLRFPFPPKRALGRRMQAAARRLHREPVKKNDWPAIIERSKFDIRKFRCGHERLDEVTRRSWDAGDSHRWRPFPVLCSSLPIAAAFRHACRR